MTIVLPFWRDSKAGAWLLKGSMVIQHTFLFGQHFAAARPASEGAFYPIVLQRYIWLFAA